ncbi:hypothetical protein Dalk_5162 [Desulfatibacillum aliphaticivorans]|uniref:Uncharacterized protein n=1 Tax=Desulfatibacillum aliphaticivorans TaxID=218208 RepID=B8FE51_DESAL|nr:hypothetical protein Dalk_5162 [Desulfatibacillum aliphaticivorans]
MVGLRPWYYRKMAELRRKPGTRESVELSAVGLARTNCGQGKPCALPMKKDLSVNPTPWIAKTRPAAVSGRCLLRPSCHIAQRPRSPRSRVGMHTDSGRGFCSWVEPRETQLITAATQFLINSPSLLAGKGQDGGGGLSYPCSHVRRFGVSVLVLGPCIGDDFRLKHRVFTVVYFLCFMLFQYIVKLLSV